MSMKELSEAEVVAERSLSAAAPCGWVLFMIFALAHAKKFRPSFVIIIIGLLVTPQRSRAFLGGGLGMDPIFYHDILETFVFQQSLSD